MRAHSELRPGSLLDDPLNEGRQAQIDGALDFDGDGDYVNIDTSFFPGPTGLYYWTTINADGIYNLTLEACELGTPDLYCINDTHYINIKNTPPILNIFSINFFKKGDKGVEALGFKQFFHMVQGKGHRLVNDSRVDAPSFFFCSFIEQ